MGAGSDTPKRNAFAHAFTPTSLNARLLPQLLATGIGIIAIQQGQRLEQAYLTG